MSQPSPRPSIKTRRAAAAADGEPRDEAAVPDAAGEQLRIIGQANALVSELADARRRVADSKTLKQSHVDALVNATLEYVKVPDGDAVSKRIRQDEAVEKIIAALSQLYITVFQVLTIAVRQPLPVLQSLLRDMLAAGADLAAALAPLPCAPNLVPTSVRQSELYHGAVTYLNCEGRALPLLFELYMDEYTVNNSSQRHKQMALRVCLTADRTRMRELCVFPTHCRHPQPTLLLSNAILKHNQINDHKSSSSKQSNVEFPFHIFFGY
jgi:hypothetical protein